MTYEAFFNDKATTAEQFSDDPRGDFYPERFVEGKPAFRKPAISRVPERKTLFFFDPTFRFWSLEKEEAFRKELTEHLSDFSIYFWDGQAFSPGLPRWFYNVTPVDSEQVAQAAMAQFHLTRDQVQVLDNHACQYILSGGIEQGPRTLYAKEMMLEDNSILNERRQRYFDVLQHAVPPVELLVADLFAIPLEKETYDALCVRFPKARVIKSYQHVFLSDTETEAFLMEGTVTRGEDRFTVEELPVVNALRLGMSRPMDLACLSQRLMRAQSLQVLSIGFGKTVSGHCTLAPNSLVHVKKLMLDGASLPMSELQNLIESTFVLESLTLSHCPTSGRLSFTEGSLNCLRTFTCGSCLLSGHVMSEFLKASQKLETLNLNGTTGWASLSALPYGKLSSLKSLDLSASDVTVEHLQALLSSMPCLESLDLSHCQHLIGQMTLAPGSLSHLKTIQLSYSKISAEQLKNLLEAAPNLEWINFDNGTWTGALHLEPCSLLKLKHLNLSGLMELTALDVQSFLQAAPCLEKVYFPETRYRPAGTPDRIGTFSLSPQSLSCLNEMFFSGERCAFGMNKNIQELLQAASQITALHLHGEGLTLSYSLVLPANSLPKLKKISVYSRALVDSISFSNLQGLLEAAAPALETLQLTHYYPAINSSTDQIERRFLMPGCLSRLRKIELSYSAIQSEYLRTLLDAAQNLIELDLSYTVLYGPLDPDVVARLQQIPKVTGPERVEANRPQESRWARLKKRLWTDEEEAAVTPPTEDQDHDPSYFRTYVPSSGHFKFQGLTTKNQGMLIERLSQYLTLHQQDVSLIPYIQGGICYALAHYVKEHLDEYSSLLEAALAWDGQLNTLPDSLAKQFNDLIPYVRAFYPDTLRAKLQWVRRTIQAPRYQQSLGDTPANFLSHCHEPCVLLNPWHAITVRPGPLRENQPSWIVYDPNFVAGPKTVTREELLPVVEQCLGKLIALEMRVPIRPELENPNLFLEQGGLFMLARSANAQPLIARCLQEERFSNAALEGLLLRDIAGIPCWVHGLSNPATMSLTLKLLKQFRQQFNDWPTRLGGSSSHPFSPNQLWRDVQRVSFNVWREIKDYFPSRFTSRGEASKSTPSSDASVISQPIEVKSRQKNPTHWEALFAKRLETWSHEASKPLSQQAYCQACVEWTDLPCKRLIELEDQESVTALRFALEAHAIKTGRPVFYIHTPEELVCSAPFVEWSNQVGQLHKGPGGRLHRFLTEHADDKPILIVNYTTFKADDIVRLNELLDKTPRADGTPLPSKTVVIGLTNSHSPTCYRGADFYSRFDEIKDCPLSQETLHEALPKPLHHPAASDEIPHAVINLFSSADWKKRLLGGLVLQGQALRYQEGELQKAWRKGHVIELQNAPWHDEAFQRFWQEASLRGYIDYSGGRLGMPKGEAGETTLQLMTREGYDWEVLNRVWQHKVTPSKYSMHVVTRHSFYDLIQSYQCIDDEIYLKPGLIAQAKQRGEPLRLHVTYSPTVHEWAQLLSLCAAEGVRLYVYKDPEVILPYANLPVTAPEPPMAWNGQMTSSTELIESPDVDRTIEEIKRCVDGEWIVIDVSDCSARDLIKCFSPKPITDLSAPFQFKETSSDVLHVLHLGKHVLLTGQISPELADELAPFLLARQQQPDAPGRLVLLSEHLDSITYCVKKHHDIAPSPCIPHEFHVPLDFRNALGQLTPSTSAEETALFTASRLQAVNDVLAHQPYVFLSGLSGVGKTTFVTDELSKNSTIFLNEEHLTDWATSTTPGRKLLFIDEANFKSWSLFEGLFQQPRCILIGNKLHYLTEEHQVVFAGNPVSYGGDRTLSSLFVKHGNDVVFHPMPLNVVYEKILKPLFSETSLETPESHQEVVEKVLDVYRFLCECSTTDVLISPRELQMMILLVIRRHQDNPQENLNQLAQHYAYQVAQHLVPIEKCQAFQQRFKIEMPPDPIPPVDASYLVTSSRQEVASQLTDLLRLREWRETHAKNVAQQTGGLGGFLIEGAPGIGKSELVLAVLRANGYEEMHDFTRPPSSAKPFYRPPASLPRAELEALFKKAAREGAIVFQDEVNSTPLSERLLNQLLMDGLVYIGTKNPTTLSGRYAESTAILRRSLHVKLPEYPVSELNEILSQRGLKPNVAMALSGAFQHARQRAETEHLTPAPTLRDVLRCADNAISGHKKAIHKSQLKRPKKMKQSASAAQFFQSQRPVVVPMRFSQFEALVRKKCKDMTDSGLPELLQLLRKQGIKYCSDYQKYKQLGATLRQWAIQHPDSGELSQFFLRKNVSFDLAKPDHALQQFIEIIQQEPKRGIQTVTPQN